MRAARKCRYQKKTSKPRIPKPSAWLSRRRDEPASPVNLRGLLFFVVTALACGADYSASENETISLSFRTSTFRLANAGWLQTTLRFIALPVGSIRCALSIGS